MEEHPNHTFTKLVNERKALLACAIEVEDALEVATQEFFRRMASTGYLAFDKEDAKNVSAMCRGY
jgi:hypothetical protein